MIPHDAVLFDFDGVLVDSEPLHFECWGEILKPFGIALPWDYYEKNCIGVSDRAMIATLVGLSDPPADFESVYAMYPAKKALFRERVLAAPPFAPDTIELIHALAPLKVAVVTSSGRSEVEPVLERLGILNVLDATVYGGDVARLKPAPDPYLRAAELLGVRNPLVVEDSEAGVASGRAAGFDVLQVKCASEVAARVRETLR
ncbi:MAG: HAD family phosphatase [Bryobacteraceae bacterium]|nr:HAD family phosphatase [Bryobacteraceae bacterium]